MREAVVAVAGRFWDDAAAAGVAATLPRPVAEAAEATLPLAVVAIPELTPAAAGRWLRRRGLCCDVSDDGRSCRGLLHAARGRGVLFVRAADPPDEQRLTVAHEVAHFLLHYLAPRRQLLAAFGESAAGVLDGDAAALPRQRVAAALAGLRLGPHVHLLDAAAEENGEREADDLAVELLAPTAMLRPLVGCDAAEVARRFGVPVEVAVTRLRRLRPRGRDPFVAWMSARILEESR